MLVVWVLCAMITLSVRSACAWQRPVLPLLAAHHRFIRVDDGGDEGGDEGGDGGDGWVPWWFGMRMLAPRRRVIVEQHYYSAPPEQYSSPPPQSYWYFCQNPEGYYPQVHACPDGWMRVVPGSGAPPPP
ncbi:MAG: hypothetical protein ACYDB1_09970 [Acidiferrobacteraceae bacterium]